MRHYTRKTNVWLIKSLEEELGLGEGGNRLAWDGLTLNHIKFWRLESLMMGVGLMEDRGSSGVFPQANPDPSLSSELKWGTLLH